jgi:hypothetical protein
MVTHVVRNPPPASTADKLVLEKFLVDFTPLLVKQYEKWSVASDRQDTRPFYEEMRRCLPVGFRIFAFSVVPFSFTFSIGRPSVWRMACHSPTRCSIQRVR